MKIFKLSLFLITLCFFNLQAETIIGILYRHIPLVVLDNGEYVVCDSEVKSWQVNDQVEFSTRYFYDPTTGGVYRPSLENISNHSHVRIQRKFPYQITHVKAVSENIVETENNDIRLLGNFNSRDWSVGDEVLIIQNYLLKDSIFSGAMIIPKVNENASLFYKITSTHPTSNAVEIELENRMVWRLETNSFEQWKVGDLVFLEIIDQNLVDETILDHSLALVNYSKISYAKAQLISFKNSKDLLQANRHIQYPGEKFPNNITKVTFNLRGVNWIAGGDWSGEMYQARILAQWPDKTPIMLGLRPNGLTLFRLKKLNTNVSAVTPIRRA